jgi:hypothetical protein
VVNTRDGRLVANNISGVAKAFAEIDVLAIEEETLVKATGLFESGALDKKARTFQPFRVLRMAVARRVIDVFGSPRRLAKYAVEGERLRERGK